MMSSSELLKRYVNGERDFSGSDLRGIKLYGSQGKKIDLSGANFSGANLEGAILSHVNLDHANFSHTNLKEVRMNGKINNTDFSGADLTNAHIGASRINGTKFRGANLTNVDFGANGLGNTNIDFANADCTNTKLTCDLIEANFQGSNLRNAIFRHQNLYWYRANLSRANLSQLDLSGQNFSTLEMKGVNLNGSNLTNTNLKSTNLEGANLRNTNLENADLTYANLRNTQIEGAINLYPKIYLIWQIINQGAENINLANVDLSSANLQNVNFSGLNLRGINFQRANLTKANFSHADLSSANLKNAYLSSANLESANLSQVDLTGANLKGANLNQANLNQANLIGANLKQARLQNANLHNANLTDANLEGADFTEVDLTSADLTGTKLFGTNLTNARNTSGSAAIFSNSPNNPNLELLEQIRQASQGLYYGSEADYPYEVFLWEVANRGEFTLEGLLKAFGYLREISSDDFRNGNFDDLLPENKQVIQSFRTLLLQLKSFLTNLQVYRLAVSAPDFYIVIGNTPSGDWLGISTKVSSYLEQQHYSSQIFRFRDSAVAKLENQELIVTLENEIAEVRFASEYLKSFVWEIAERKSALIHNLLDTVGIVTTNEVKNPFGSETQAELVRSNLTNLRLYRLSAGEIEMYIIGQTENGDWIGLHTKAVET
ncbi:MULTISPECIES: pentapeptide repeat-containing protein [unclassified Nodularia (in: cyanobacteria)]|uniref:pentapeptide repeat-containing protein n=1 Tax=unclassified Nodularia (in: cyanobacteria) TaxID=2656917 RepID=UPI0018823F5E|nr:MULTISPECIES: pentapeptide repeat-containing protein [unclassified Nodularia (in: cyanobacteria)]MBE9197609.1 pentapeptide repeat-containing protein [Nodularia sp. LEGE 06071]MCC2692114.1 pentapeptide repeat-containing protein [Nodularia sp. LEGE 04288]